MVELVEIVWLVLAVVGVTLVASGVQHIAGMGFGLVAVPVLFALFGAAQGVLWGNIIGLVTSVAVLVVTWRDVDWGIAIRFTLASVPAIALTVYFTQGLDEAMLNVVVGIIMLVMVGFTVFSVPIPHANGHAAMYVTGALGGFLSASVGQSGPVLTAYARAARWPQRSFVATLQVFFSR